LGEGRFGICYLVKAGENAYVLKQIKPKIMRKNTEKIIFEEKILSSVDYPAIPHMVDTIKNSNIYAYVMEYKKGKTLEEIIFGDMHRFTRHEIQKIGIEIINTISYLHERNIVHRDIRVPNVIVQGNSVYLVDFGLARFADGKKYRFSDDFSGIGHLLLHLYYSSFTKKSRKSKPWYEELELTVSELKFLKKLLALGDEYKNIFDIKRDFLNRIIVK
jgi:serine/threonine-protein kinase